ncbi:hypothetical protein D3C86_1652860 [compost metagenome]
MRHSCLDRKEDTAHIDAQHLVEVFQTHGINCRGTQNPCIHNHCVNAAETRHGLCHRSADRLWIATIRLDRRDFHFQRRNPINQSLGFRETGSIGECYVEPLLGESFHCSGPNATRATKNESRFANRVICFLHGYLFFDCSVHNKPKNTPEGPCRWTCRRLPRSPAGDSLRTQLVYAAAASLHLHEPPTAGRSSWSR